MKIAHLADLHLGIRLHEYLLLDDQRKLLMKILNQFEEERPDVLLITGDIYDKANPSEGAIELWNDFLISLAKLNIPSLMIAGNHDSAYRLGFADKFLADHQIYIETRIQKEMKKVTLYDDYGPVHFYFLPFFRPAHIRNLFEECHDDTYQDAASFYLSKQDINFDERNVLLMHQFVIASGEEVILSDSETAPRVGGLDSIDAHLFEKFDYVAMGHIHRPQKVLNEFIRYAGSPMKYSFSEHRHHKSMPFVKLLEKGKRSYELKPLPLVRDVRILEGDFENLLLEAKAQPSNDLLHVILHNKQMIHQPLERLRVYYPHALTMELKTIEEANRRLSDAKDVIQKNPIALFETFFERQVGRNLSDQERSILLEVLEEIE